MIQLNAVFAVGFLVAIVYWMKKVPFYSVLAKLVFSFKSCVDFHQMIFPYLLN